MMATTYVPIQSITLASSAASVTFSSIPQTYTDLVVMYTTRSSEATTVAGATIYPNSLDAYIHDTNIEGYEGAAYSSKSYHWNAPTAGASTTTNTFSTREIYIANYASASIHAGSNFGVVENNSTLGWDVMCSAMLHNTATAITSIQILANGVGGSFVAGSTFHLYGIK